MSGAARHRERAVASNETMTIIDKLAWIHVRDGKLLVARSRGKTAFFLPGGKREANESDVAALIREIGEELATSRDGVTVPLHLDPATVEPVHVFEAQAHGQPEGTLVRMTCLRGGIPETAADAFVPAAEIEELAWFGVDAADRVHMSLVTAVIVDWLAERGVVR